MRRVDVDGYGVYRCINPLRAGATRRSIEDVGAVERLVVDIDCKDLIEPPGEVERKLRALALAPTWVRASGGGFHVGYELKEPIEADDTELFERARAVQKDLVARLSGDPAPAHPAALLREEGTYNRKRGEPVLCRQLFGSGQPVDITDIETLIDLLPEAGLFAQKAQPRGNGYDRSAGDRPGLAADPEAALAAMVPGDKDAASMPPISPPCQRCSGAGTTRDDVLAQALAAAMQAAGGLDWNEAEERRA